MKPAGRMQHLTTVTGSFHGRVLAARLGAEGVLVELRGLSDGPYPLQGPVDVYVQSDQLELAREILLADAVEDAFEAAAASAVAPPGAELPVGTATDPAAGDPAAPRSAVVEGGAGPASHGVADARRRRLTALAVVLVAAVVLVLVVAVVAGS